MKTLMWGLEEELQSYYTTMSEGDVASLNRQLIHKPGPAETHAAINVDALPTCIYPGAIYLCGRAAEQGTDGGMTVYQLSPAEDAQKAAGELFANGSVHECSMPGKLFQHFFPG